MSWTRSVRTGAILRAILGAILRRLRAGNVFSSNPSACGKSTATEALVYSLTIPARFGVSWPIPMDRLLLKSLPEISDLDFMGLEGNTYVPPYLVIGDWGS